MIPVWKNSPRIQVQQSHMKADGGDKDGNDRGADRGIYYRSKKGTRLGQVRKMVCKICKSQWSRFK